MTALNILGVFCIILFCFGGAITVIVGEYKKTKPTKIKKDGKRELKINRISYWEYLIIILPICLLLIGLFTNDRDEMTISFSILGIGLAFLLLSSYNNRIVIPWVNNTVLITSITLVLLYFLLSMKNHNYKLNSGYNPLTPFLFPFITYTYLVTTRKIIQLITNTYPLTLDKHFRVGNFSLRYNRKATYWDLIWTLWNLFCFPFLIIFFLSIMK